jgi:hypothetical protein
MTQCLTTTTATLEERTRGIPWDDIPPTFQDAISLTRYLGIRYIWIDSLCIIQDDEPDWQREAAIMGSIYGNSYLTIAATASNNSSEGLFRCHKSSLYRSRNLIGVTPAVLVRRPLPHTLFERLDYQFAETSTSHEAFLSEAPLLTRAWTLQEHFLPPRVIQFTENEIIWECNSNLSCECRTDTEKRDYGPKSVFSASLGEHHYDGLPPLYVLWSTVIEPFTARNITYSKDKLPAISGVARRLQETGAGRYLAGLWYNNLRSGLCWFTGSKVPRPQEYRGPTWSWVSVNSRVSWPYGYLGTSGPADSTESECASILVAECSASSIDPTGAVSDGYLELSGLLVEATYTHDGRQDRAPDTLCLSNKLERWFWADYRLDMPGRQHVAVGEGVYSLLLGVEEGSNGVYYSLVLRRLSSRSKGFERIGFFFHLHQEGKLWYASANRQYVRII